MEVDFDLIRWIFSAKSTIGVISLDGSFICNCIEDCDRGLNQSMSLEEIKARKMYGITAIPYGRYKILIQQSPRFSQRAGKPVYVPYITNVPGYSGVEIHSANFASQLLGCIAPGMYDPLKVDSVWFSKQSYQKLFDLIKEKIADKDVFLKISKSNNPIKR